MKAFGKLLMEFRQRAGLSQNKLAQLIKANPSHISRIERGIRNPPRIETVMQLKNILNLNKKEEGDFISSALHYRESESQFKYSSPLSKNDITVLVDDEKKSKILESPAIKLIADILNDPKISLEHKKEIDEQISSFVAWLKNSIKSKGK
jgi:transcriptional regulator with XRE-family HTH domain